jgi:hypothetical protein
MYTLAFLPNVTELLLICISLVSTAVCPVLGYLLSRRRCQPWLGILLGLLLGPVGVLIVLVLPEKVSA